MPPSPPPAARAPKTALARTPKPSAELGPLPEWDLSDLYPGMDSPEFAGDVARAEAECHAFARAAPALKAVARGAAPRQALPARRQARAALPREVGHRPRRLEPALRRDHGVAALRGARRGADARADAEQAAGPGRDRAPRR